MAKDDAPLWALVGILFGMLSAYFVNPASIFYLMGALAGGSIGYMLGKAVP